MNNLKYYFPGSFMILLAIAIMIVPEILVAIVAATIIMVGIIALRIGHMMKQSEVEFDNVTDRFFDEDFFGRRFARIPIFNRQWHRRF
jgi:hypothetical protein